MESHLCGFCTLVFEKSKISAGRIRVITGRNEVAAKVMFLQLCVILFTGGGGSLAGRTPWAGRPPLARRPPSRHNPPPTGRTPWTRRPPWQGDPPSRKNPPRRENPSGKETPPGRETPRHTVNVRSVRILLECILVQKCLSLRHNSAQIPTYFFYFFT